MGARIHISLPALAFLLAACASPAVDDAMATLAGQYQWNSGVDSWDELTLELLVHRVEQLEAEA